MAIKIQTTDNVKLYDVKTLVYGPSGVGKTRLAITIPDVIVLSAEEGLLSLKKHKIPFLEVKNYKQLVEAIKWLGSSNESRYFNNAMLDSLSELSEVILAEELKQTSDARKAYGSMQQTMYELMRYFRDFKGKNITLVGKMQVIQEGLSRKCVPIMPSEKLLAQVPYFWDEVFHMYNDIVPTTGQSYTAFHTKDNANWTAKDRSGALAEIEEPHMGKIFAKILAS